MAPPHATPVPYRAGAAVDVGVEGHWRRAEVVSLIATTALSDHLRFRVLYRWRDGDGPTPPQHCGPDGHGRLLRPARDDLAVAVPAVGDGRRVALGA